MSVSGMGPSERETNILEKKSRGSVKENAPFELTTPIPVEY